MGSTSHRVKALRRELQCTFFLETILLDFATQHVCQNQLSLLLLWSRLLKWNIRVAFVTVRRRVGKVRATAVEQTHIVSCLSVGMCHITPRRTISHHRHAIVKPCEARRGM